MINHIIYKDEDKQIAIDGHLHQYLHTLVETEFKLDTNEMQMVQQMAMNILIQKKINFKPITVIKNIVITKYNAPIQLKPPHNYFNKILQELSQYKTLDIDYIEIEKEINEKFKKENLFCYIFPHRIFDKRLSLH